MNKTEWIFCPICGSKTRLQIREDTVLKNYPLYCPKCKQESLIDAKELHMKQIQEWLGHSDFSTTANVYAHLDYNSKLSSADAMVNGLSGALEVIS